MDKHSEKLLELSRGASTLEWEDAFRELLADKHRAEGALLFNEKMLKSKNALIDELYDRLEKLEG
jgi:hypothetical protein